ncbi:hypothetical protein GGQ80_001459 [Sphingomonas jinjuensis]|uniref:Uncharacterized protein n=1 Tax=Sphingomonas jinjuensis TaxID=535907 RepID=A0A840FDC0_9SPHN|nr:hypothetical protein [Sphingomonas jinjuensis]MBB4153557.1 hypothetical protein [Sphingomonas jinjuensis]
MTIAFHGDPALQSQLVSRLGQHRADGTLIIGDTRWDGARGSPLGVLTHDTSIVSLATLTGYPLALAGLLDPLAAIIRGPEAAGRFARQWLSTAIAGADLAPVPALIVLDLLDHLPHDIIDCAVVTQVGRLHRATIAGESLPRAAWNACRQAIIEQDDVEGDEARSAVLDLVEAAAWPTRGSRSVLATMIMAWCRLAEYEGRSEWSAADEDRAQAMLRSLWDENRGRREAGDVICYPALFAERDPSLASRFEANLSDANRRYLARVDMAATLVIDRIASVRRA